MAKTYFWTGAVNTSFGTAANWNDFTDSLNPSPTVPGTLDTVSFFLATGGTISGTGTVDTLQFNPFFNQATQTNITDIDWIVTGTLEAIGTNGIQNGVTLTLADGAVLDGTQYTEFGNLGSNDLEMLAGSSMTLTGAPNGTYLPNAFSTNANATIDDATLNAAAGGVNISGALTAEGGATVTALNTSIFNNGSTAGTLTITGSLTTWHDVAGNGVVNGQTYGTGYMFVGDTGTELIVSDDATLTEDGAANIQQGGAVTIESGAVWTIGTGINLSYDTGTATLAILSGGTLHSSGVYDLIAGGTGGQASVTVDGTGSTWSTTGALVVGNSGTGELTVSNDAVVSATSLAVGQLTGGSGTLTIETGGTVDTTGSGYGAIEVGNVAGSNGIVYVDAGSTLEITGAPNPNSYVLQIGSNGASGTLAAASGAIYVSGTGALLNTGTNPTQIARAGDGTLSVTDGGEALLGVSSDASTADAALSVSTAGDGNVLVDGTGSAVTAEGSAYFSRSGTSTLTVSDGGRFIAGDSESGLTIGFGSSGGTGGAATATVTSDGYVQSVLNIDIGLGGDSGTVNVSDGGEVEAEDRILVGVTNTVGTAEVAGTGFIDITAGGTVQADGNLLTSNGTAAIIVGLGAGSTGTIDVSGAGAVLSAGTHYITIGNAGTGYLNVTDGGSVETGTDFASNGTSDSAMNVGTNGGTGSVTVSGTTSTVTAVGQINVGDGGSGYLLVESGGTVDAGNSTLAPDNGLTIGYTTGGPGTVTVTGAGSEIINVGHFIVGGRGSTAPGSVGTLLIEDGALVRTSRPDPGPTNPGADIAAQAGTGGSSATVTGAGSIWEVSGDLRVGDAAAGSLTLSAGGVVTADTLEAGVQSGSAGVISVTGGSTLDISGAGTIGEAGSATLSIDATSSFDFGSLTVGTLGTVTLAGGLNLGAEAGVAVAVLSGGTIASASDVTVGQSSGETSSVTVSGTNAVLSTTAGLFIGQSGTGELTVSDDAIATVGTQLVVGQNSGGSGTLTIETGGTVDATGSGYGSIEVGNVAGSNGIVYVDSGSTLEITGASTPTTERLVVGGNASSTLDGVVTPAATGAIYVSGTGALLTTDGNPASIGNHGTGTLSVTDGATASFGVTPDSLTADSALFDGYAGNGSILVDGVGSSITATGNVYLAQSGTATLTVSDSGRFIAGDTLAGMYVGVGETSGTGGSATVNVTSDGYASSQNNIYIGYGGDSGTVNVSDGGEVEAEDRILVGATNTVGTTKVAGTGFIDITAGGTVQADGNLLTSGGTAAIAVGLGAGSTGTIDVSGAGALLSAGTHYIVIGSGGAGYLNVTDGGSVESGTDFASNGTSDSAMNVGTNGGTGSVTVSGTASTVTAVGQINVGDGGSGYLLVESGGTVNAGNSTLAPDNGLTIGYTTGGPGTVTVTGAGSEIINVGHFIVGGRGSTAPGSVGTLLIEDGALVRTSRPDPGPTNPGANIAAQAGTGGSSATVTGAGSIWEISGDLRVGDAAAGSLTISAGGVVTADTLEAGLQTGSSGVINVTGGSTLDISGAGTIGEAGSATLSIDATSIVDFSSLAIGTLGTVELAGSSVDWTSIANAGALGGTGAITADIANSGTVAAVAGTLAITGAISGTGTLSDSNGELKLNGSVGSGQTFDFIDADSTLYLSDPVDFAGTIAGFGTGDTIVAVGANSETLIGDVMELFQNGNAFGTLDFASAPTNMHIDAAGDVTCFLAGTLIATERGERPVEDLAIGDRVRTASGALRPIKWLGYRSFRAPFVDSGTDVVPVRIAAGALAEGVPARDLIVSPLHAMLLDGALIPAGCLVNDASIRRCPDITDIDYIHIELDSHDIILAEGAPAETFVDCDSRMMFHNALDFARRYPNDTAPRWAFCAPRVESGFLLEHVRDRLAARAGLPPANPQGGRLLGYLEAVTPNGVRGWAFQPDHPGSRAVLEVVQAGGVVARVIADQFRPDLRDAGHGDGCGGFDLRLEHGFSLAALSGVQVRRASDGVPLSPAGGCFDQVRAPDEAHMAGLLATEAVPSLDAALGRLRAARWQRLSRAAGAPRVLMMDVVPPNPGRDAGSRAIVDHAAALLRLGYRVEFVATRQLDLPPSEALLALGVLCHGAPGVASVEDVLRHRAPDVIYLHRAEVATAYAAQAAALCPGARRIYALADLHHLRFARQARVEARPELAQRARAMQLAELFAISQVHAVITHSSAEAAVLARIAPGAEVHVVPWSAPVAASRPGFADRSGLAFVGGAAHAPNIDAVRWLTEAIMPAVWARHPAMECLITGAGWPERLPRPDPRIRVLGVVDDLAEVFDQVRLSVAPLRFGAGLKGKVLDSLAAGLPCVMTPIAAEGFDLPPALRRLVAEDAASLADAICRVHAHGVEHAAAARAGLQLVRRAFSPDAVDAALREAVTGARFRLRAAG